MNEDDLRSALTVLSDRGPETRYATTQADRRVQWIRSRRRRVGLLGVAAAVIVVAGASGIVALARPTITGPPAATPGSTLRDAPGPTGAVPRPLLGYDWTAQDSEPKLPVAVPIPAGYTSRQMKFNPALDYVTIAYTAPSGSLPSFSVTVGRPAAFVEPTGTAGDATPSSRIPTTMQRRSITTASGVPLLVQIDSSSAVLARSLAAGIAVTPTPAALGIRLSQLPAGGYIGGARTDPDQPRSPETVEIVGSAGQAGAWTLTLRTASGLPASVGTTVVHTLDGRAMTVHVGTDTTSWILLGDGRAILLTGYPLSGAMLRDALAFPQSTLLPLLAGSSTPR